MTDDEIGNGTAEVGPRKVAVKGGIAARKTDYVFDRNSLGEPLIPENYKRVNLETQKHIVRSFLKIHYGTYHNSFPILRK